MPANTLTSYETWNLTQPVGPPRSRLYHLEPIGVGTANVESLASYITRLAVAHSLSIYKLAMHEIRPVLNRPRSERIMASSFFGASRVLHGTGQWAAQTALALEKLTCRNELLFLTLWHFNGILSRVGLSRSTRAWCPACYNEWRQADQTVYDPLLWTLQAVTVCPQHHQCLRSQCPNQACQAQIPFLPSTGKNGYCPHCGSWLGLPSAMSGETALDADALKHALWKAKAVGELLAAIPYSTSSPSKARVAATIATQMKASWGDATKLARGLGISPSKLGACLRKTGAVELDVFLEVCCCLGLSPLSTLFDSETLARDRQLGTYQPQKVCDEFNEQPQQFDVIEMRQVLTAILNSDEEPLPSVGNVAQRTQQSPNALRYHLPELCRAIVDRRRAYYEAEELRARRELEASLTAQETPPLPLAEIARRLEQSPGKLRRCFPELCQAIVERHRTYQQHERSRIRQELENFSATTAKQSQADPAAKSQLRQQLEMILLSDGVPPSLGEVCRRLGCGCSVLYCHFPDLCHKITARRRACFESEKLRIQYELEIVLARHECPSPSVSQVARRLGQPDARLRACFPDLCRAITKQYEAYRQAEKLTIQRGLEAVLADGEAPAPSLAEVARRLGYSPSKLRAVYSELCHRISARHQADRQARTSRKMEQFRKEVRQATLQVWRDGFYPTLYRVSLRLSQPAYLREGELLATWREVLSELGLSE
jgi:hypothetical protein